MIYALAAGRQEATCDFHDEGCPRGEHYYYLRVSQEDGEFAWSSPIWVRRAEGPGSADPSLPAWNAEGADPEAMLPAHEATQHETQLRRYLELEEDAGRWEAIRAVRIVPSPMGRYVLLLGYDRKHQKQVHSMATSI